LNFIIINVKEKKNGSNAHNSDTYTYMKVMTDDFNFLLLKRLD